MATEARAPRRRRGQALVELALVLPIMLFLVMGILQIAALGIVWISLQNIAQDTARWMAVSSTAPAPGPAPACAPTTTNYPRPRWANGNDGVNYRNCNKAPILLESNFTAWTWDPPCSVCTDCFAAGLRGPDQMLRLTATYNWSNVIFIPGGLSGWFGWLIPPTVTVTVAEVMQY